MGVSTPVVLRLPPDHVHNYGSLLAHLRRPVGCEKQRLFSSCPPLAAGATVDLTQPPRACPSVPGAEGLGTARFTKPLELQKRPPRRVWAWVQLRPPNPPPRPASGSHRLPNTLGQVGEQYGPSISPFARARCPFLPHLRPYFPGGAARGSHTVTRANFPFSCFGFRTSQLFYTTRIGHIPNEVWPLAVGG
jgi:hypothetical protein